MSQWLARAAGYAYDPEEFDVMESWLFRSFGQAAVPGLIEAMKDELGCLAGDRTGNARKPSNGSGP